MSEKSLRVNLKQETWQQLRQYCQASRKDESEVIEELITSLAPSLVLENDDQLQQFRQFSQTIPVPLIVLQTPTGKIEYANNRALTILGFSLENLSSLSLLDLCQETTLKEKLVRQLRQNKISKNYELKLRKENNQDLYASIFLQPLQSVENKMIISWCDITFRHQLEEELKEKKRILQLVLDNIPQLIFWKDTNSVFLGCNRLWAEASGMKDPDEVRGKTDRDIYSDPNNEHLDPPQYNINYYIGQDVRVLETGKSELNFVEHKLNPDGQEVWYNTNKIPIKDAEDNIVGVMGTIENITERKLVERALSQEKELAQVTLKSIGEGVITTNNQGIIREFNTTAEKLTGWTHQEAIGNPIDTIFKLKDEIGNEQNNIIYRVLKNSHSEEKKFVGNLTAKDGKQYKIDIILTPIVDQELAILGAVLIFRDITEFSQVTDQLSWDASHDNLTGLVNRKEFQKELTIALESCKNQNIEHSLCYLDLDQFKIVNDTCNHLAGDELLRQITYLLQQRIRNTDILARLGGDEFALLLKGCSLEKAEIIANMLRQLVKDFRFSWGNYIFSIGVSIGIVSINDKSQNISSLIRAADRACYNAKEQGRNRVYVYQANDIEEIQTLGQNQWITKLSEALTEDDFYLYCQKIVPLQSSTKVHYEILLRLADNSGNLIAPLAFIPAAERYNLMAEIDQWVIKNFLKVYSENEPRESLNHIYMINLSAASFKNEKFIEFIEQQLSYYGVNPQILCFEITETLAISNLTQAIKFIESIKKLGCSVAIDNFGSGISSLTYLKHWPVDYLKIDENFINNLTQNSVNYVVVDCFHRISHVMNMETIAECVENQETLDILQTIGIDYAQGFAVESPIPLSF